MSEPRAGTRFDRFIYVPQRREADARSNSYSEHMVAAWRRAGLEPAAWRVRSLGALWEAWTARRRTVAIANWVEACLIDAEGRWTRTGALRYHRKLLKLRLLAARVIFVRHNRFPHGTRASDRARVEATLQRGVRRFVDVVVSHDDDPALAARYLPHPAYPVEVDLRTPPQPRVVCFGRIGPYKSLERLIEAWRGDWPLLIAGAAPDAAYLARLEALAVGRNVSFHRGTLSDADAAALVAASAAAIVAHNPPSMIVSGSIYFALSCGTPVLAVGLPHARRLRDGGLPGVHFIESLDALPQVDWATIGQADRHAIHARMHRDFGRDAMARALTALLHDDDAVTPDLAR